MNVFDFFFEKTRELDKLVVLGPSEQVSYKDLYSDSLRLSGEISRRFGQGKNILVLSENSVFFITVYLSILKSGNRCVPLNPAIEWETFQNISGRTQADVLFVSKKYAAKYDGKGLILVTPETVVNWLGSHDKNGRVAIEEPYDGNEIAEIIFTSGSTGEQKGVMITHNNIIANTNSIVEYLKLTPIDTVEVVMPFYYCYGLSLLHTHLRVGGSVVLNNTFVFLGSVINDINKFKCTGFAGVPSHFQILLRKSTDFKKTEFPSLRYVTQAGGKLHTVFISEFMEAFPGIDFYVMYGQTEATARLSYLPPGLLKEKLGSIGKGIPGVDLKVVDERGNPVNPGETGEIVAKGENIMHGYFGDPESTRHTIRNGWLHTGDLATVDRDGYIFIQSRKKEIIKVRGIRVSPKEIEEVIFTFPGVVDCTIEMEADELLGESLKAIVFVNDPEDESFKEDAIRSHCAKHLSQHKIPQKVVFESRLTFNASGKKTKQ